MVFVDLKYYLRDLPFFLGASIRDPARFRLVLHVRKAFCMLGCVKSVLQSLRRTGPSTTQRISERRVTSFAEIRIWSTCRLASAMVAPKTIRSSPAQSAFAMHMAHGSHVEYI